MADTALRKLLQAKIGCSNSCRELEVLNSLTDDWDGTIEHLEAAALDIHLQSESGVAETTAIHDGLLAILLGGMPGGWTWTEMELRQENAVSAVKEIIALVDQLASDTTDPTLNLKEIQLRGKRILAKLDGLKHTLSDLKLQVEAECEEEQT